MWFLGVFLRMDIARIGNVVLFIVMCWLAYKDSQLFEKAGLPKPIPAWIVFPPVYFYKRGKIQGQTMKLFKRSLGTFAVICAVIIFPEFFADFQPLEKRITAAAPQAVNQIAAERFPNASKCTKVTLNGQVSDNKYKGTAFLDNGNTVEVDISLNGDSIYVEIPMSQFLKF
ncbi:MAG: hypothetical protein LBS16_02990 [Prevotellaceae bacterium]|nr:hypothetical protein [Prevotellaceae bacterium]